MSDFAAAFDELAHAELAGAGLGAALAIYTPPGVDTPAENPVRIYLNRGSTALGTFGQLAVEQPTVGFVLADVRPAVGAQLAVGDVVWRNVEEISNDGTVAWWAVRRG